MKLLVDLFACQTYSRMRGIGRYTLSLSRELARLRGDNTVNILTDALYPESLDELRQQFIRLLPAGSFLPYFHEPLKYVPQQDKQPYYQIAETLIEQAYRLIGPDIILTPSLFDSWADGEEGRVALPDKKSPFQFRAVILYDLIPYIFHELYLDPDANIHRWFLRRMELLKQFDLILAISESTRQDAINILKVNPERVVNISGAASYHFHKIEFKEDEKKSWLSHLGITRPFVLYIGGNDYRKNMEGALRAFADLPYEITSTHQLVLNDTGDENEFRKKARALGLEDSDLVIFKRTSDEELTVLYNLCKLFIFPSLYEGFGLPVLEAMICGAPVIASNNSSLPEVVGRNDALFDPSRDKSVTSAIYKGLTDEAFRADLAAYGMERAKLFSWEKTAKRAWEAIESLHAEKQVPLSHQTSMGKAKQAMRLAYVSPLPPQKSGVAEYSAVLLPYLAEYFTIDLFTDPSLDLSKLPLGKDFTIYPWNELLARRDHYAAVLYQMGNSELHIQMLDLLQEIPGVVVTHDFFFSNLPFVREIRTGERGLFQREMDDSHGLRGVIDYLKHGIEATRWEWPLNWKILKNAQELIVHSEHQYQLIKKFYAHGWNPNPIVIKHLHRAVEIPDASMKVKLKQELGFPEEEFVFCSFGFLAHTKLNLLIIQAFSRMLADSEKKAILVFVGELDRSSEYGRELVKIIQDLKISNSIRITGYLDLDEYNKYLGCADAAIQLRTDSRGETSGALLDCLAYGVPTIINAHGSFNDFENGEVLKLPESPDVEQLSQAMIKLQIDQDFRQAISQTGQTLIHDQHDPKKVALAYAQVIQRSAQTTEAKLFAPLLDALQGLGSPPDLLKSSARFAAAHMALRNQPCILIDVTSLQNKSNDMLTQSESVLLQGIFSMDDKSIHFDLVYASGTDWIRAGRFAERFFELPELSLGKERTITVQPGDVLLMLDGTTTALPLRSGSFEMVRQRGGRIVAIGECVLENNLASAAVECDFLVFRRRDAAEKCKELIDGQQVQLRRSLDLVFPDPAIIIGADGDENYSAAIGDKSQYPKLSRILSGKTRLKPGSIG